MTDFAAASALLLAGVFAWAGVAKLRRPRRTAASFKQLGLPAPAVLAVAVPVGELALAATLVARPRIGGVAALVALAAFSAVLAVAVSRGADVACGCFGAPGDRAVSSVDLARNGGLAVLALLALTGRGWAVPSLPAAVSVTAAAAAGLVALALLELRSAAGRLWDNSVAPGPEVSP